MNRSRSDGGRIAGYSFLILFLELALIRYLPGYVRVFGFYINFVLLATFLGMGVGLLKAGMSRSLRWGFPPALLLLLGVVKYFSAIEVTGPRDPDEFLWGAFFNQSTEAASIGVVPAVILLFVLTTVLFVPLGALLGAEFRKLKPLAAYSWDIAGSLVGILTLGALSALRMTPAVWFALSAAVFLVLSRSDRRFTATAATAWIAAVVLAAWTSGPSPEFWSKYYRVNVTYIPNAYNIEVNGMHHQYMVNLDPAVAEQDPWVAAARDGYLTPLRQLASVDTVLVVGAGTGNDVALLLELGARYIDAVEIDGVIAEIGINANFLDPYADERVHLHIDDARSFLNRTDRTYDVVLIGTLDSHTLLSGMVSVRLDNYVYTVESFASAADHLKDDGAFVTFHLSPFPYIAGKIFRLMESALGSQPMVIFNPRPAFFNYAFIGWKNPTMGGTSVVPAAMFDPVEVPSDNWPYLYLRRHTVPAHYVQALSAILLFAALAIWWAGRGNLAGVPDLTMFAMGAGFLLMETASVTEMSLLFGSTWAVNLAVFSGILLGVLGANAVAIRNPIDRLTPLFLLMPVLLAIAFTIPVRSFLTLGSMGWIGGIALTAVPIFVAALVFANLFRQRTDATRALGYNLLGAMCGGVLEYSGMALGLKSSYLFAAAIYLVAFASWGLPRRSWATG